MEVWKFNAGCTTDIAIADLENERENSCTVKAQFFYKEVKLKHPSSTLSLSLKDVISPSDIQIETKNQIDIFKSASGHDYPQMDPLKISVTPWPDYFKKADFKIWIGMKAYPLTGVEIKKGTPSIIIMKNIDPNDIWVEECPPLEGAGVNSTCSMKIELFHKDIALPKASTSLTLKISKPPTG